MTVKYTEHENLIIQTYMNFIWLHEMHSLEFVKTNEYKQLNFSDKYTQNSISERGVINQGTIPVALYSMLVIPKETIFKEYADNYNEINAFIASELKPLTKTNYKSDKISVDYLRHLRNSVSHVRFDMTTEDGFVIFKDENSRSLEKFECKLSNLDLGAIVEKLSLVHKKYIQMIQSRLKS